MQNKGFPADWLYQLKQKNNIVSVIERYVRLEKKGRKFWGCCPFHNEKTPSFSVSEEDGLFYCFGCKESGDVISFVMKYESCDFYEAVKILAKNAGMEVPEFSGEQNIIEKKKNRERLLDLLDQTMKHYQQNLLLPKAKEAQDYIKLRQFNRKTLEDFKLGYSIDRKEIIDFLKSKGFTLKEMMDAGVVQEKNGYQYDVYGGRLIFPICNSFGECVGFSARVLGPSDFAKYINTAETSVFRKGRVVYAIDLVKKLKQQGSLNEIIIVEGQIDVIAMHKAGFNNTVACMGTALTQENAHELKKLSNNVVLMFDGDGAGQKATYRSLDILREEGFSVRVALMPDKLDPDEILKTYGKEKIVEIVENALPPMDYIIENERKKFDLSDASEKSLFVKQILTYLTKLDSYSEEDIYLTKLRDLTSVPIDALRRDLEKEKGGVKVQTTEKNGEDEVLSSRENGNTRAVKFVLSSIMHRKDYVDDKIDYFSLMPKEKQVLELAFKHIPLSSYYDYFDVDNSPLLKDCINYDFSLTESSGKKYFEECLWLLASSILQERQAELSRQFKECKDNSERLEIMKKLQEVTNNLKTKNMEDFYAK